MNEIDKSMAKRERRDDDLVDQYQSRSFFELALTVHQM